MPCGPCSERPGSNPAGDQIFSQLLIFYVFEGADHEKIGLEPRKSLPRPPGATAADRKRSDFSPAVAGDPDMVGARFFQDTFPTSVGRSLPNFKVTRPLVVSQSTPKDRQNALFDSLWLSPQPPFMAEFG